MTSHPRIDDLSPWHLVSIELDYDEVFSQSFMQEAEHILVEEQGSETTLFCSIPQKGDLVFFSMNYGPSHCIDRQTTFGIGTVSEILHCPVKYVDMQESFLNSPDIKVFLTNLLFDDNGDEYKMLKRYRKQTTTAPPEAPVTP